MGKLQKVNVELTREKRWDTARGGSMVLSLDQVPRFASVSIERVPKINFASAFIFKYFTLDGK